MDYATLKSELAIASYASLSDIQAADVLNDPVIASKQLIETRDIQKYLILFNKLLQIEASTEPAALMTKRALSIFETFDMSDPLNVGALTAQCDGLIAVGLLTNSDKAIILGMGDVLISRSDQLGLGIVKESDVLTARGIS